MIITAAQHRASRQVEGKSYLLNESSREAACGKAADTCRKQAFLATLTRNQSDFAVCSGWGGPVNSGDSTGSISVFCSAWMIPVCGQYPQATITTVAQTAEAKSCQRLPPRAPRVPPNERPGHPGEMPQPGTKPVKSPPKPPPTESPCAPEESGGIDVLLEGEFFGRDWASGEVSASASDGSPLETASVGYDYVSAGHFGPWECGTTVALTATPGRGSHFDRWVSSEGLCATAVPTCTVPITTTTHQLTAYFAPTIYQLSVVNQQPEGRVTSGSSGGYVSPGIDCGSSPNGSSTEVFSSCTSQAIAQRSDDDVTQLYVSADNPGPGGDTYGVASIDGCDRSVATQNAPVPGGGGATYVPAVQCFIDMNSDRTITVSYKDVGR
jgi:hypothetical protein